MTSQDIIPVFVLDYYPVVRGNKVKLVWVSRNLQVTGKHYAEKFVRNDSKMSLLGP